MGRATEELLSKLHGAVATELLRRVETGEASPADIAQAVKLLKDNGIEVIVTPTNPLGKLAGVLPFKRPAGLPSEDDDAREATG